MARGEEVMDKTLVLRPRMSEKAYALSEARRTYVFDVATSANKNTIAGAVAAQYEVTVTDVRVVILKGKKKRTVRKGGRAINGKRSDVKKAYVTLKEGDSLPIFAAVEEAEAKEKKAEEKAEKAAAKKEKK
jgi:large subunit ribosomal protein L23